MHNLLEFHVKGNPIPKGRPRVINRKAYTPKRTRAYENIVGWIAKFAMKNRQPFDQPLIVTMSFTIDIPPRWSQLKKKSAEEGLLWPKRHDVDNLAKSILDACNGIVFEDDGQVCELHICKQYGKIPGCHGQVMNCAAT